MADARRRLPKGYDVDTHFNPHLRPVGPADVPRARRRPLRGDRERRRRRSSPTASSASRRRASGWRRARMLEADVVVTATGLNMLPIGRDRPHASTAADVDVPETTIYKSMMLSDVPNFAFAIGYTNASWTLKVDLVCEHLCRLLAHMDVRDADMVVPVRGDGRDRAPPALRPRRRATCSAASSVPARGRRRGPWTRGDGLRGATSSGCASAPVDEPELRFRTRVAPSAPVAA